VWEREWGGGTMGLLLGNINSVTLSVVTVIKSF